MAKHRSDKNGKARSRSASPRGGGDRSKRKIDDRISRRVTDFLTNKDGHSTGGHIMHRPGSRKKVH